MKRCLLGIMNLKAKLINYKLKFLNKMKKNQSFKCYGGSRYDAGELRIEQANC